MPSRIEDYALIGDCQTAALVARDGSIDWLCLPRFDSPACFAALLGTPENGRWRIAPAHAARSTRRSYRDGTLILETCFTSDDGEVTLIDFMPIRDSGAPELIRIVEGKRGKVPMRMELIMRCDYGSIVPWVQSCKGGITAIAGPDKLRLASDVKLRGEHLTTVADFTVSKGDRVCFDLTWYPSHERDPKPLQLLHALKETEKWWKQWSKRCKYKGEWCDAVVRSLITLKALTYAPTGGIVAAPTTSLPEQLGGVRNWDYRFCWLRDATFTLFSLLHAGYLEEACAWREWLLRAIAGTPSNASIMYGVAGERRLTESELDWLPGYENSRPVRCGNAAHSQFQLDVYGEVGDMLYHSRRAGLKTEQPGWQLENALLEFLETAWQKPDEGIWEVRGPRRQFTHSKMMAWVAFDRAVKSAKQFKLDGPVKRWQQLAHTIHEEVCREGYNAGVGAFTQFYGSKHLDASLLMMALVGFLRADDPRVLGTVKAIEKNLLTPDGYVMRYNSDEFVDGLPEGEAAFLPCTFWLADNYALQGRDKDARQVFEQLLKICNDVGLLSEEYDPRSKRLLGNFPQAFSHIGLINTAHNLTTKRGPARKRKGDM